MVAGPDDATAWLKLQEEVVVLTSAFLDGLRQYLDYCDNELGPMSENPAAVYHLQRLINDWDNTEIHRRLQQLGLVTYFKSLVWPPGRMLTAVTRQTIPTSRVPWDRFMAYMRTQADEMGTAMLAFAKVPPPTFSGTLAAEGPFQAYLLLSALFSKATEFAYVIDAYLSSELFTRYMFRIKPDVRIVVVTNADSKKWGALRKAQFEQAEELFRREHPRYERVDRSDLHARYLLTDAGGWRIDTSLRDAGGDKECPIHTVAPEEQTRLIALYVASET